MPENLQKFPPLRKLVQSTIVSSVACNNVAIVDDEVPKHYNQINSQIVRISIFEFGRLNALAKEKNM